MSTATQAPPSDSSRYVDYDEFIDFQVQKTRAGIKTNDLLTALIAGSTAVLAYVLVFAVFDHWIIDGGFGRGMRFALLGLLVTCLTGWCVWKLVLPYFRKVSSLYAAKEIEDAEPELHSTLVTLVDLKRAGREVSPEIRAVLEKRAGLGLTHMDVEQAVDRRLLMRLSYVLLGLVVVTCLYTVFSPKKLSNSLWRALLPTSAVAVDTRTQIDRVQPGDVEVLARAQLVVTADLSGEVPNEVTLLYSTSDNRLVDEPIAMRETDEGLRQYRGVITGENGRGILQNLTYRVIAGDATSPTYAVTVKQPPSATVEEVQYDFPDYMQFFNRTQVGGSIDAYEGTEVTIRATANMPISSALLRFSDSEDISNKAEEYPVTIENGTELSVTWRLKFRSDGTKPNYYHILCRNDAGEEDPNPTLHPIKMTADEVPEIKLLHPTNDIERPANAVVPLLYEARDDFKLRAIILHIEQNGEKLPQAPRLYEGSPGRKRVSDTYRFDLSQLVLNPGDRLTYWLEARDNLQPFDNRSLNRKQTPPLDITILEAASPEEVQQQLEDDQQQIDDQLEADAQSSDDDRSSPPPSDDTGDNEPPPPSNDEPSEEDRQGEGEAEEGESQPTEAGESGDAGEQTGGESGESGGQQQRQQGSGERQQRQPGEQSEGAGEQQSKEPGQSGQAGEEEAPFEEVLERLMQEERQRQHETPDQENAPSENTEQQREERQPQGDAPQPNEQNPETGESSSEGEMGESGESQSGETGERSPQQGESSSSQSRSGNPSDSQSDSGSESSPSDSQGESSGDTRPQSGDDSQPMSENPPVREGETAGGEPAETEATPSPDSDSPKAAGTDGEPMESNDAQSGDPMSGEPESGQPSDQSEGENSRPAPEGAEGDPSPMNEPQSGEPAEGSPPTGEQPQGEPGDAQSPMPSNAEQGGDKSQSPQSSPPSGNQKQQGGSKEGASETPQPNDGTPKDASESSPSEGAPGDMPPSAEGGQPQGDQQPANGEPMPPGNEGTPQEGDSSGQPGGEGGEPSEGPSDSEGGEGGEKQEGGGQQEGGSPQGGGEPGEGKQATPGEGGASESGSKQQGGSQQGSPGQGQAEGSETQEAGDGSGNMAPSGTEDSAPGGAGQGDAPGDAEAGEGEGGEGTADNIQGDDPDLESQRKAANLVLKRLEEQLQRGEIDPELREELGVTDEQMQKFTQRLKQRLADTGEDLSPEAKARRQQFNETLRNLDFDSTGTAREGGDGPRESTGGFAGPQRKAPARRRDATEAYRRLINRKKNSK